VRETVVVTEERIAGDTVGGRDGGRNGGSERTSLADLSSAGASLTHLCSARLWPDALLCPRHAPP
jgi:hypothetical protein